MVAITLAGRKCGSPMHRLPILLSYGQNYGIIRGFIIDRKTAGPGLTTPIIEGKLSLRASITGSIQMDNAFVSDDNIFPRYLDWKGLFHVLTKADMALLRHPRRAEFCYDAARQYTSIKQFDRPLAANQLIQLKLADMHSEISIGLQACLRVAVCWMTEIARPKTSLQSSATAVAKRWTSPVCHVTCMEVTASPEEYHVMRHLVNLETVNTYEGTP